MNMIIGGSRKKKSGGTGDQRRKNDKASILARKRERWKVQKEVRETQNFNYGQVLGNGASIECMITMEIITPWNKKRPFLPGRLESASPHNVPSMKNTNTKIIMLNSDNKHS